MWGDGGAGGLTGTARRVAEALRRAGPSTRAELVAATRLSRATVSATVAELSAAGLVDEGSSMPSGHSGGRPATRIRFTREAGLALGLDIGRHHIRAAVADLAHRILAERDIQLVRDVDEAPGPVLQLAARLVDEVLDELGADRRAVVGACVGIPAPVTVAGVLGAPMLLPGWAGLDLATELSGWLRLPVTVHNDANLGALSEYHWGAARGCPVLVYVKLATGIGAGIMLGGQLFVGSAGTAGEIGHVSIDARGPVCRCGNRGCVELSAGGRALVEHARLSHPNITDLTDVVRLAVDGDPGCRRLLSDAAAEIGVALSGLVNLLNPDRIVLGGYLGGATELMLGPLRRGLTDAAMPAAAEVVTVTRGELGERAAVLGAVLAALHAIP